jgi:hypothetical protein
MRLYSWIFLISTCLLPMLSLAQTQAPSNHRQVWPATAVWTDATETEYAEWIKVNATHDFFTNPNKPLGGVVGADCADAAYMLRAVFAYEKRLPFIVRGVEGWLNAQNISLSSRTELGRLREFLGKIRDQVSVETLKWNSFPIELNSETVKPGILFAFAIPQEEGTDSGRHTYTVRDLLPSGLIHFVWATVPAVPRPFSERIQWPYYMPVSPQMNNQWGFRRFFQPQDYELLMRGKHAELLEAQRRRGRHDTDQWSIAQAVRQEYEKAFQRYQERQRQLDQERRRNHAALVAAEAAKPALQRQRIAPYQSIQIPRPLRFTTPFVHDEPDTPREISVIPSYHSWILSRLATGTPERMDEKLERDFRNLCYYARERVGFVEEGYNYFFERRRVVRAPGVFNRCPTQAEIYDYTTPSRDNEMLRFLASTKSWYLANREEIRSNHYDWFLVNETIYGDPSTIGDASKQAAARELVASWPLPNEGACQIVIQDRVGQNRVPLELSLRDIRLRFEQPRLISPWPWVSMGRRWGLQNPPALVGNGTNPEAQVNCSDDGTRVN